MYINKVMTFKKSWDDVCEHNALELSEITSALDDFISKIVGRHGNDRLSTREIWDKSLHDKNWELIDRTHYSSDGRRINVSRLGPKKRGLSVSLPFGAFDTLSGWIFQQSTVAIRAGLIKIPIMLVPTRDFDKNHELSFITRFSFEMFLSQLELLSPLSHQFPFLILGYSNHPPHGEIEVFELESGINNETIEPVVDRSIEFPPEYHQAGLDILNYFGTYLREQYPEENASVKIEQNGLTVRLVIETKDGKCETIERALHEYELIVTGNEPPEKFTTNDKLILELKNEVRIAQFRLESQRDIIGLQNTRIDKLLDIVSNGLSNKQNISIDFKPEIKLSNTITINKYVSSAQGTISELLEEFPKSSIAYPVLSELEESLVSIETDNNPNSVRKSPAMSRFRRLIDKATEAGSELNAAISKLENGWEILSDVAIKYNKIAEWCGLPCVPSVLIKARNK